MLTLANVIWASRDPSARRKLMNVIGINRVFMVNVMTESAIIYVNVRSYGAERIVRWG